MFFDIAHATNYVLHLFITIFLNKFSISSNSSLKDGTLFFIEQTVEKKIRTQIFIEKKIKKVEDKLRRNTKQTEEIDRVPDRFKKTKRGRKVKNGNNSEFALRLKNFKDWKSVSVNNVESVKRTILKLEKPNKIMKHTMRKLRKKIKNLFKENPFVFT